MSADRNAWDVAMACIQLVDHGAGEPRTFDEAREQVEHPLRGLSAEKLREVVTYLAAQVVGYQHRGDQNAPLALVQIKRVLDDYELATR